MESVKLNWMRFGEYMNGESTAPHNLDEYFEKVFERKFSTNNYNTCDRTTCDRTTCDRTTN